ncbi:protein YIPF4 [Lingula anatina]|uniref:Protein YIPF n=1 Tax=Lingula anatina TaxID=7574 RepID=A0A1S3I7X0_LINAN|nr:protein YIPF4 [Lingula anatina]|eukprot:XP_013394365.1 protein YIPF4 [Lingula anatina]
MDASNNQATFGSPPYNPGTPGESQYMVESPSKYMPTHSDFQFVDVGAAGSQGSENISGTLESGPEPTSSGHSYPRKRGPASQFLENKGFGWLLEEDEDVDEEDQRPLLEELDIDIPDILYKLRCVLLPVPVMKWKVNREVLRDNPDFWGPLVVVLVYSLLSLYGQFRVISWILTIWVFGSMLVFMLARVLGGEVTYSQCLGIIGYSLLPLVVMGTLLPLVHSFYYISMVLKVLGVVWATYSAGTLLCVEGLQHKKPLLLYPVFLLYIYFFSLYTGA